MESPLLLHQSSKLLSGLCEVDLAKACRINTFCTGCLDAYCSACCSQHEHCDEHLQIKIVRGSVHKSDIGHLIDTSKLQDKLIRTSEAASWSRKKLDFLHGVALHPNPKFNSCSCSDHSYCTLLHLMENVVGATKHASVRALLAVDFQSVHYTDQFCIDCNKSYNYSFCRHHDSHRIVAVKVVAGQSCVLLTGREPWRSLFEAVDRSVTEDGRFLVAIECKLSANKKLCSCGYPVAEGRTVCAISCLGKPIEAD